MMHDERDSTVPCESLYHHDDIARAAIPQKMFNFTFATGISLVALLVHLPSVSAFILADGGFGNNLHLLSFSNTGDSPLGVRQLGQGPIPTECDSVCYPVISLTDAVSIHVHRI
jgi:hypothetical protein